MIDVAISNSVRCRKLQLPLRFVVVSITVQRDRARVVDIVPPIIKKIGESSMAMIGRQFDSLIHYKRNIEVLRNHVEKLEGLRNDVQEFIDDAMGRGEQIRNRVKNWIARVDGTMVEAKRILEDDHVNVNKSGFFGCFPDSNSCCRLSGEAEKKTIAVKELEEDGKFDSITYPAPRPPVPPSWTESLYSGDFITFETTKLAMERVMNALNKDKINFIGITGMAGVGKTTLMKEIAKKARDEKVFDYVVMVVVSRTVDLKKIQDRIAHELGLRLNEKSELGRAGQLYARLKAEERILVILDDVWARLDVKDIGIPFGIDHEGCKIVITTRRTQVCSTMSMGRKTTRIIHLNLLSGQESWDLFRINAGDTIDSAVAEEVARACRGSPIALVTVGRAMRGKNLVEWEEAVKELKKSMSTTIENVDQIVFRCLKLSHNYLTNEEAKSCFLLCSLFPADHEIEIEYLVRYWIGLGIFENVDPINERRGRILSVINDLKASRLLLASVFKGCIKMCDVVRDVAISIGSNKNMVKAGVNLKEWPEVETLESYTGISLMYNQILDHPDAWECPNLQILLMQNNYIDQQTPEGVFKGMKAIKVLDRSGVFPFEQREPSLNLETSFSHLKNLRTLILEARLISDTTALGEIKTLEIISFAYCEFLESLKVLKNFTNLRLLDLRNCSCPSQIPAIIPPEVISSLSRLEELYMGNSISSGTSEGRSRNLLSIADLKSLPRLVVLTVCIEDIICIPENFVFPDLKNFKISIGPIDLEFDTVNLNRLGLCGAQKMLLKRSLKIIQALLRRTNYLSLSSLVGLSNVLPDLLLDGDSLPDLLLDVDSLNVLKTLKVEECDGFESLINTEEMRIPPKAQRSQQHWFNGLEELYLFNLKNFQGICRGELPPDLSFVKLKKLKVVSCPKLSSVPLIVLQRLPEPEILSVKNCEAVEYIFDLQIEGLLQVDKELLASLRELELVDLDELKHVWKGPTGQVILHNLQVVHIRGCDKLKNLFRPAIARRLEKLEHLRVYFCDQLEEIVGKEQEREEAVNKMVFPQLKTIELYQLYKLDGFCMGSFPFEWPSLVRVEVYNCPKLKTFTAADGTQRAPKLKTIKVDWVKIDGRDLNTAIRKHFKEKEVETAIKTKPRDDPQSSKQGLA